MKMLRNFVLAAAALASLVGFSAPPALAANIMLCSPVSDTGGSRRVTNPNTTTSYVLDGRGCGLIAAADTGYFRSQGFTPIGQFTSQIATSLTAADSSIILPAGAYIQQIVIREKSGGAVTGGVKIGTTSGATDIVAAAVVGASALVTVPDVSQLKRAFSATAPQQIFIGAVSSFAGSQLDVTVVYGYF